MEIYYINNDGDKLDFSDFPLAIEGIEELFSSAWDVELVESKKNNSSNIDSISRTKSEKKINIQCFADTKAEFETILEDLIECCEKDLLNNTPGKLYVGEWYLQCFIYGITPSDFEELFYSVDIEANILSTYPFWLKEKKYSFYASEKAIVDNIHREEIEETISNAEIKKDYPRDFPYGFYNKYTPECKRAIKDFTYDFYHNHTISSIHNDHYAPCGFELQVSGPCTKVSIWIGNHLYECDVSLADEEYLIIDSRKRTIVKYAKDGIETNMFNSRSRTYDIFKKLPTGKLKIQWNAQYPFCLNLIKERSVPVWSLR